MKIQEFINKDKNFYSFVKGQKCQILQLSPLPEVSFGPKKSTQVGDTSGT